MQITVTNGTITQVQETLSAKSGSNLPTSISVSGATSSYDSSTGSITLTNLTNTISVTDAVNSSSNSITDLTGYTWVGKSVVEPGDLAGRTFAVNFSVPNDITYDEIAFTARYLRYSGTNVFESGPDSWKNTKYQTVIFDDGTDVTDTDLIAWLQANGTLAAPTPSGYTITIDGVAYSVDEGDLLVINQTGLYNSTKSSQIYTFVSTGGRFLGFNTASGQSSPSIGYGILDTFTALEDLVLYSVEQQPAKTFDLSTLELSSGDHTITVKSAASGYGDSVASNIITYNASSGGSILRIYDAAALAEVFEVYSDGVKVADVPTSSAPDNAILDSGGNYIKASDGYIATTEISSIKVTITGTDIGIAGNNSVNIYDGEDDSGTLLGSVGVNETKIFDVTSGYVFTDSALFVFADTTANGFEGYALWQITEPTTLYVRFGGAGN